MPELARVLMEEDLKRPTAGGGLDLGPYLAMIEVVLAEGGVGATVELAPGEQQRSEKGRLTRAARERGQRLVWRKAPAGHLRFVLAAPDGTVPGSRKRRAALPPPPPKPVRPRRRAR